MSHIEVKGLLGCDTV